MEKVIDPDAFEKFYRFAFTYSLTGKAIYMQFFLNVTLGLLFLYKSLFILASFALSMPSLFYSFRRVAEMCRHWDCLHIDKSCAGI